MKTPAIYTPGPTDYTEHTVTTYEGGATLHGPSDGSPTDNSAEQITCGHRHAQLAQAKACAERKVRAEARRRNAADTPAYAATPCRIAIWTEDGAYDGQPGYLIYCKAHRSLGGATGHLHQTMDDAVAAIPAFTCPWAKIAARS